MRAPDVRTPPVLRPRPAPGAPTGDAVVVSAARLRAMDVWGLAGWLRTLSLAALAPRPTRPTRSPTPGRPAGGPSAERRAAAEVTTWWASRAPEPRHVARQAVVQLVRADQAGYGDTRAVPPALQARLSRAAAARYALTLVTRVSPEGCQWLPDHASTLWQGYRLAAPQARPAAAAAWVPAMLRRGMDGTSWGETGQLDALLQLVRDTPWHEHPAWVADLETAIAVAPLYDTMLERTMAELLPRLPAGDGVRLWHGWRRRDTGPALRWHARAGRALGWSLARADLADAFRHPSREVRLLALQAATQLGASAPGPGAARGLSAG